MSHLQQGPSQTSGMSQSGQPQNPELRRELMEAFNMLDTERKGYLSSKEMKIAVRAFGLKLGQKEQDELNNANKTFKFDAFEYFMTPQVLKVQNSTDELQRLFNILDINGSKSITFENLKEVSRQAGENFSDQDLREIIEEADMDKDRALNFLEFSRLMRNELQQGSQMQNSNLQASRTTGPARPFN